MYKFSWIVFEESGIKLKKLYMLEKAPSEDGGAGRYGGLFFTTDTNAMLNGLKVNGYTVRNFDDNLEAIVGTKLTVSTKRLTELTPKDLAKLPLKIALKFSKEDYYD
jgi:hypothetical protein